MQLWVVSQPENQQPCGHLLFDPFHSEVSEWSSIDFKKREREGEREKSGEKKSRVGSFSQYAEGITVPLTTPTP